MRKRPTLFAFTSISFLLIVTPCGANEACISAIKAGVPNPESVQIKDAKIYTNNKADLDELLKIKLNYANTHLGDRGKIHSQCLQLMQLQGKKWEGSILEFPEFQSCVSENLPESTKRGLERVEILHELTKSIVSGKGDISGIRYRYQHLWTLWNIVTWFHLCVIQSSGVFLVPTNWSVIAPN